MAGEVGKPLGLPGAERERKVGAGGLRATPREMRLRTRTQA